MRRCTPLVLILSLMAGCLATAPGCSLLPNFGVKKTYLPVGSYAEVREPLVVKIIAHDDKGVPYPSTVQLWPGDLVGRARQEPTLIPPPAPVIKAPPVGVVVPAK
jgi:hypothetical protein